MNGRGPSLKYRFGFARTIDEGRVNDPLLQISDVFTDAHRFQGRTSLNPSRSLSINLSWQANLTQTETITFRGGDVGSGTETVSGNNKASVWVFNPNYVDLVQRQIDRYEADGGVADPNVDQTIEDANGDGVVLTNTTVVEDFREVYGNSSIAVGGRKLLPLPLPNWNVTYSGFGKWPLIRKIVQSASIRHTYSADYGSDYRTNSLAALDGGSISTFTLGRNTINYATPDVETGAVRVNRRYQPLIGFDFTFKNRLQTNVSWNKNNSYSLSTSSFEISDNATSEVTASLTYQKTGLRIPFLKGKKLNNRVSFSVSFARSTTNDKRYRLGAALAKAVSDPTFQASDATKGDGLVSEITSNIRTTISPQVSYTFSNRVQANFVLRYVDFKGDTRQPSNRNINGTFNIRVNISDR
ncbi:MAG: hypothetical protein HKN13_09635 [Rhodothermales bacterium]|nr:hypothetical protein [Rhodothermales bacterium]